MFVEELTLENIKCFEKQTFRCAGEHGAFPWVTLLGENGVGKSTVLQALGLLLAGPEGANQLLTRPAGWLRDESKVGKLSARIHKSERDPGDYGEKKKRAAFSFTFFVTGAQKLTIRNKEYTEPAIVENSDRTLSWLRQNAFPSKGKGWFAAGFGAFRRLTRRHQIIVPSLQTPERYTSFLSQFNENEPLAVFEQWFVHLDYRIAKDRDNVAQRLMDLGVAAINKVLPGGAKFDSVSSNGGILFDIEGQKVPTLGLSDGYRSVLALAGDLIWRLLMAFPESDDPLQEGGAVLIDELDIHLHPVWQRLIPGLLRQLFPKLQFIATTHSPFIAAGAGKDAVTYRLSWEGGRISVSPLPDLAFLSVDKVLLSPAFGLVSLFSEQAQADIDRYYALRSKSPRTPQEDQQLQQMLPLIERTMGQPRQKSELERKMDDYLEKTLK
jgi:energy-coupling factor transporter ATP-binding protein EcfA2